jgi:predicted transcriptional regulator
MKTKEQPIKIVQKENAEPIAVEVIAQSIKKISDTMEQINKSKLSNRAIRVLLRDASGESMKSIENILGGLSSLRKYYLKD